MSRPIIFIQVRSDLVVTPELFELVVKTDMGMSYPGCAVDLKIINADHMDWKTPDITVRATRWANEIIDVGPAVDLVRKYMVRRKAPKVQYKARRLEPLFLLDDSWLDEPDKSFIPKPDVVGTRNNYSRDGKFLGSENIYSARDKQKMERI